jgi:hypothetical protein
MRIRSPGVGVGIGAALALASTFASSARAQSTRSDTDAYCEYVTGVADSQSDLEMAPTIFGSGGLVSGAEASPGTSILGPTTRVIAGASYSLSGLYRGIAMRSAARADCKRYESVSELHAFLVNNKEGLTRASLTAKLGVLGEAMPVADKMLADLKTALGQARATVEQVEAMQLRVDSLRALASDAQASLAQLEHLPPTPARPIAQVLQDRDEGESEAERYEGRVRRSRAWDLSVRGGYDQIFGSPFSYTPVFGLVSLTLNVGGLLQGGAEERAREGRVAWTRAQVEGVDDRVEQALARLRKLRETERKRLAETRVLLADLETRYKELQAVPGDKVAEYANYMWFDLVRTRAEHAYLSAHVADLDRLLGPEAP